MSPDISFYMVISYSGDMSPDILLYTSFSYSGDLSPEFLFKTAISYSGDSDILSPEFLFKTAISYSGDILSPEYPSPAVCILTSARNGLPKGFHVVYPPFLVWQV